MDNDKKDKIILSGELTNHRFNFTKDGENGYSAYEVDRFLDQLVHTLTHYEAQRNREEEMKTAYEKLFQDRDEILKRCSKLEAELNNFYENGYSNRVLISRVQALENKIESLPSGQNDRLERIEKLLKRVIKHWTDGEDLSYGDFDDDFF
ncbi:DivIVA domain-containing protein [Mycoplasmoides pneumoniae]|uniref:Uncharacterized protein MG211 homolog n=1 Tax=Mycoplasma pneumoniae (strain ATCC 29342 / M129 / Subtype 1) TaxID=272634 RepID=Y297_MYCPN|nr:DivIVA domain-containing protein [Mycoplasmoides pneumoniae]P75481.1 RecName: Full=Uncharacterized protein MG211 homolog [Mycoplasmoides pneumoniae M129]AAB96187.1 conserved hypothetical protein [Mycoplasmoides pneumoniae M129]AGC04219.1 hypothetical protein C985_0295 [Mycoplasmoides pneumoniae M129-B7]ALA30180.1 hypothetical protein C897_01670 [Mycoplasmoides pneumoniae PI 1428]ALA32290.1 hypothetical protein F533_01665 [Mycoplasmoides pneumoniae 51494]ALA32991.1 hypothetical protein F530